LPGSANGNGPSTFAVCSFVVRPTNGAAADHGQGAWTQAYARVNAAAVGQGQSVLDYCTGLLAAEHVDGKPSSTHGPHNGDPNGDGNGNGKQGSNPAGSQGSQGTKGSGKGSSSARSTASAHASSGAAGSTGHPGSGSAASSGRS
jgi:hypothetical protein